MRYLPVFGLVLTLALLGSAEAGRMSPCRQVMVDVAVVEVSTEPILALGGIDLAGSRWDLGLGLSGYPSAPFALRYGSPSQSSKMEGGFYDPQKNEVHVYCMDLDHTMYWLDLPLQWEHNQFEFGIGGADLVRDLSGTTWNLPLVTGTSQLAVHPNGTADLDGYSGEWHQRGNHFMIDILGGASFGDFMVGSAGLSGTVSHFGQTTKVSNLGPQETQLLLNKDRFHVEVQWRGTGMTAPAKACGVGNGDESGLFWFFDPNNTEMVVKVIDGCAQNNHFWVFAAATTTVEYTLRVTDTQSSTTQTYTNPLGQIAPAITDTEAFATCP